MPGRCRGRVGFKGTPAEYWKMRNAILKKEGYERTLPYFEIGVGPFSNYTEGVKWGQVGILGGNANRFILYEDQCKNKTDSNLCDKCYAKQNKYKEGSSPLKCHWDGMVGEDPPKGSLFLGAPQLTSFTNI